MCGAPRALGESTELCWGDALGLAYVETLRPDSSPCLTVTGCAHTGCAGRPGSIPVASNPFAVKVSCSVRRGRSMKRMIAISIAVRTNESASSCGSVVWMLWEMVGSCRIIATAAWIKTKTPT